MARRLGDPTALMLGRLTLNPIKHIDPIGTVAVPLILLLSQSGLIFGWAKPVPVTVQNLRHPVKDMAWVALAGPLSNVIMALFWATVVKFGLVFGDSFSFFAEPLKMMGSYGVSINLVLAVLNILPIPPLDGSRILSAFLPGPWAYQLGRLEPYGLIVIAVLLFTRVLDAIMWPIIGLLIRLIKTLFGF
jgi:Zn-dependent protease